MLHKVQEWEVENQNIFEAGEQIEFVDSSGLVMRGTIGGEASGNGKAGMAQVRLDFWQPGLGAPQSGCDGTRALGGREEQSTTRRLGRPACDQRLPVRVGAPSGHRLEERAKPRAVRLTSGEASGPGLGVQEIYPLVEGVPSTSRGAVVVEQEVIEDELLDYEEEEEAEEIHKEHRRVVQEGSTLVVAHEANKKVVKSDRWVGGDQQVFFAGNLPRGIELDSMKMEVRLPKDKEQKLVSMLEDAVQRAKLELRQLLITGASIRHHMACLLSKAGPQEDICPVAGWQGTCHRGSWEPRNEEAPGK
ncbi:hypothetical protein NDU88_004108 [Pleurodeles waltl]|uniref:Uncharacterized protein n=1 Tax=Pleurodeles waltl TaxID=8319 RepID=A0AAV7N0J9_PLEWA|nr:hypothetical protein NDU88_004108 [Pleurodeles waltl]